VTTATRGKGAALAEPAKAPEATESPKCLAENLNWLLAQAHFALASEINRSFEPLGISGRSYHVLATAVTGEYTQKELADLIGLDKTTMVVTVDELEAAGLAERRPSKTDRRARVISVTRAGKRKVEQGRALIDQVQQEVLGALSPSDRKVFLEALGDLVRDRLSDELHCPPQRRREPKRSPGRTT
jgi:MarR family transcriptional regulator, transcriptional regulator for hemolysin